jgi:putative restriction endonuclease
MSESLNRYVDAFRSVKVNRTDGHDSPHKPCMLLSLIGLAEAGGLERNEVRYEPSLLERYEKYFGVVRDERDKSNPFLPFFHLQGDKFWHLKALPGREAVLAAMRTAKSNTDIRGNVDYAFLDPELYAVVITSEGRGTLRDELVTRWFGGHRLQLEQLIAEERGIDTYEKVLREHSEDKAKLLRERPPEQIRCASFRRLVNENYDYRCAASGWRIILPDSRAMVEAAHLIPFAESFDDDPRNGISLAPSFHWAMDERVIAPGPEYVWCVSELLDERIADNRPLLDLRGKELILPKKKSLWPKKEALEWRRDRLLGKEQ